MNGDLNGHVVAVTGSTGFVGRHTVKGLLASGASVRALVRNPGKAAQVLPKDTPAENLQQIKGDLFDHASVRELVRGADAVVHTVGIRREQGGSRFDQIHIEGTRRVLEAAESGGVDRMVHISALGVRANAPSAYYRTKWEAERLVRSSDLAWTILRPSIIHGEDAEIVTMMRDWALGRAAPYVFMPYFTRVKEVAGFPPAPAFESAVLEPVLIDDVVQAITASLVEPKSKGEVYSLTGPEQIDWPTMLATVRDELPLASKSKMILGLPGHAGFVLAMKGKIFGFASALPFGPSEPVMAMEDSVASSGKAGSHLGFAPRAFTPEFKGYASRV